MLWALFLLVTVTTVWTQSEIVWLFISLGNHRNRREGPTETAGENRPCFGIDSSDWWSIWILLCRNRYVDCFYFLKAGAFVFGSALAIVPFLYGGVVGRFHWLTERQFLDAVAVAMITPGPIVITSGFIGYLVAGALGSCAAVLAVFLPPYLLVIFLAPYYRRFAQNPQVKAFVQGVTAAAVGAIAGAAVILSRRALIDVPTIFIGVGTLAALLVLKKVPEPVLILVAGAIGVLLRHG